MDGATGLPVAGAGAGREERYGCVAGERERDPKNLFETLEPITFEKNVETLYQLF